MRTFLTLLTFLALTSVVKADVYYKLAKVTCASEIGLFEITSTGVANIERDYGTGDVSALYQDIANKYGLYIAKTSSHHCTIKNLKIETRLNYREVSPRGACGLRPGASIDVLINGEIVVKSMPFQEDCSDWSSYYLKIDQYDIKVCGGKLLPTHCIREGVAGPNRTRVPLTPEHLNNEITGESGS